MPTFIQRSQLLRLLLSLTFLMAALFSCSHAPDPPPRDPGAEKAPTQRTYEVFGKTYTPIDLAEGFRETGVASWYGDPFHGRKTASGETYNMHARTAAHRTLPMGTFLKVRNLENNKETIVRINDRGPFAKDRIIDLSYRSATEIDMIQQGTARVEIHAIDPDSADVQNHVTIAHPDFFTGQFTVQIGAYSDKNRAETLRDQLNASGKEASITTVSINGLPVYRVRVGMFASWEAAEQLRNRLTLSGYESIFTVSVDD